MTTRPGGPLKERATGSYAWELVGKDCSAKNAADLICAEHCVETVWAGEMQFAFEHGTQFGRPLSAWIEITNWTHRQLYDWRGY